MVLLLDIPNYLKKSHLYENFEDNDEEIKIPDIYLLEEPNKFISHEEFEKYLDCFSYWNMKILPNIFFEYLFTYSGKINNPEFSLIHQDILNSKKIISRTYIDEHGTSGHYDNYISLDNDLYIINNDLFIFKPSFYNLFNIDVIYYHFKSFFPYEQILYLIFYFNGYKLFKEEFKFKIYIGINIKNIIEFDIYLGNVKKINKDPILYNIALASGNINTINYIKRHVDISKDKQELIKCAILGNNIEIIKELLKDYLIIIDDDIKYNFIKRKNNLCILKLLINNGGDFDSDFIKLSIQNYRLDIFDFLIKKQNEIDGRILSSLLFYNHSSYIISNKIKLPENAFDITLTYEDYDFMEYILNNYEIEKIVPVIVFENYLTEVLDFLIKKGFKIQNSTSEYFYKYDFFSSCEKLEFFKYLYNINMIDKNICKEKIFDVMILNFLNSL
uniref:Ankyrin repeat protein n=1 Tax=viral metagenome TaxID=1070528 RepID=A0A6C0AD08_9ZZZZ